MRYLILLCSLLTCMACEPAILLLSGESVAKLRVEGNTIYLKGVLGKSAHHRMERTLKKHPQVDTIVFVQSSGSMNDDYNIKTAELLHEKGISTKLLPDSEIASGAVDLFLAGKTRIVSKGAKIGIHSWSDGNKEGRAYPKESKEHELFWKFYEKIDIDTSFYWYTLEVADFENIYWLNEAEIDRFKVRKE